VPPPSFDLVGVVLSSLSLAGLLAVLALVLGGLLGSLLILRRRNAEREPEPFFTLNARVEQR
jgi:hypothetical protein